MPDEVTPEVEAPAESEGIKLKKELGLMNCVGIIVGVIIGSGIFVSPTGVLEEAKSVGLALIAWIFSGILSLIGALCYAELGTMIPKSGGDYAYITYAFGPLPGFLFLWVSLFITIPGGNAILALTFAEYILKPFWPECNPPFEAIRLLAAVVICLLTAISCYNVKCVTRVQDVFTATKIFALIVIIGAGLSYLFTNDAKNFADPMKNSNTDPGKFALAVYSGLFSFSGWNYLNFVTEELKDPYRNLPRAICISLPLITLIYFLANLAYFAALSPTEFLASNAVAVTLGDKLLGPMAWIIPVFVACSTFGSLNGIIFSSARLFMVGARNGHLPNAIALININNFTPMPSLILLGIITLVMLIFDKIGTLINYVSFVEALFNGISVAGLLYLRFKCPDLHRPIKVYTFLPVLFLIICVFLVVTPFVSNAKEVYPGVIIVLIGIPVYYAFIGYKNKPMWLQKLSNNINTSCQKLFMCVPEDKDD